MRKDKIHEAEIFCRKTFLRNPSANERAEEFYAGKDQFGDSWPDWCCFPMAATYAILTHGADVGSAAETLAQTAGVLELPNLTAALIWDKYKLVYRYDDTLAQELSVQDLSGNLPIETFFRMPCPCVFVEYGFDFSGEKACGFFAWMECDAHSSAPELRLLFLLRSGFTLSMPVILTGGTIDDSVSALSESALKRAAQLPPSLDVDEFTGVFPSKKDISTAINLILYLCSDEPDIKDEKVLGITRSRNSDGSYKRVSVWDVGTRIGAALRKASNNHTTSNADGGHQQKSVMRPHVRRAHWHSYWTGKRDGERTPVLKWIHPVIVNSQPEEIIPAVIHPVKRD